jgi:hypothetical protein
MLKDDSAALLKVGSAVSRHGYDQAILWPLKKMIFLRSEHKVFATGGGSSVVP